MIDRSKRRQAQQQKKIFLRCAVLLGLCFILALLFTPGYGLFSYRKAVKQQTIQIQENQRMQKENEQLAQEIDLLKNDEKYIENVARKEYGLLKKNEEVYEFKRK
ncbi:FtsB family cell division protein [Desulfogranum japonicum]|uniref:FtsB family cell division protein n=1 Tax=Desulfogranum japonicum TaxID=231447 RepID=UPI000407F681|nr:septum formation initiator family protein [Desulfogranum japonicum]